MEEPDLSGRNGVAAELGAHDSRPLAEVASVEAVVTGAIAVHCTRETSASCISTSTSLRNPFGTILSSYFSWSL